MKRTKAFLGHAVIFIAILVMFGWFTQTPVLVQVLPNLVPMQFNTAALFFLVGLYLETKKESYLIPVFALSAVTVLQDLFGLNFGIDQFLFTHHIDVLTPNAGRMSPMTALSFITVALGAWTRPRKEAYIGVVFCLLPILGYVIYYASGVQVDAFFTIYDTTFMALHTSVLFSIIFYLELTEKKAGAIFHFINSKLIPA